MRYRCVLSLLAWIGLLAVGAPALADDLTAADQLLCAVFEATVCVPGGECTAVAPEELNVPRFVETDLRAKTLSTTAASGENRTSPIAQVQRVDGLLLLQGAERGRAYSIQIVERTGELTAAVARNGVAVVVFGACTPLTAPGASNR